jgi:hypothetical protein
MNCIFTSNYSNMDTSKLTSDDLHINFDNPVEYERHLLAEQIIFNKAKDNEKLTEVEKDLLCRSLQYSIGDQPPFDLANICENYNFKFLYLVYFGDLTGGSIYFKPGIPEYVAVPINEAQMELAYLKDAATDWQKVLDKADIQDELLIQIKKEADFAIVGLKNSPEFASGIAFGGSNRFRYKTMSIYLHSKFIYLLAKEIFESFESKDLILKVDNKDIIINEYSIVHVVSRHYAKIIKQYETGKSFHNKDFQPRLLSKKLSNIFDLINNAGGFNQPTLQNINFVYNQIAYRIYTTDTLKNTAPIKLSTFFPVDDINILDDLKANYTLVTINDALSFYRKLTLRKDQNDR